MYTEEVMKHFQNPKNMGEVEDSDGVGEVGNPVCLPIGSEIQANPSLIPIEHVEAGQQVLSHDGNYNKVSKKFVRQYSGDLISIKSRLGETKLTPDHLVKAIKVPKEEKYLRIQNKKKLLPDWYHSEDLDRNDILLYPISKKIEYIKTVKADISRLKFDFRSKSIPQEITLDNDFLRLAGYFIAEGHTSMKITNVSTTFTFGYYEKEYVEDTVNLLIKIFKVKPKVRVIKHRHITTITVSNVYLTRFFNKLFGKGCTNKVIPEFMLFLPLASQKELIRGLWRGDGFINPDIPRAGFSTTSYKLAQQLKFLLTRQGICPSIYTEEEKVKDGVHHKKCYRIHVGGWSVRKLAKLLAEEIAKKELTNDSWADKNYLYLPINSVNKIEYSGKVYNLEVENAHSYTTDSALIHNCGDVMRITIKVDKNKKGKEIIKDIKFKTFGCIAAIASSSITTELVKGKTLDEAAKLTNLSIAKSLGELPPIKLHCSVLAADALKKAIADYKNKAKKK